MRGTCFICKEPVEMGRRSGWARRIIGWEEVRRQGGANKVVLRETTGEVAHTMCLDRRVIGLQTNIYQMGVDS